MKTDDVYRSTTVTSEYFEKFKKAQEIVEKERQEQEKINNEIAIENAKNAAQAEEIINEINKFIAPAQLKILKGWLVVTAHWNNKDSHPYCDFLCPGKAEEIIVNLPILVGTSRFANSVEKFQKLEEPKSANTFLKTCCKYWLSILGIIIFIAIIIHGITSGNFRKHFTFSHTQETTTP